MMTLPSSSSVRKAMFGVKRGKRAREEEEDEDESEEQPSTEERSSPDQRIPSPDNEKNSHDQQHQKQMSPAKMAQMLLHYQNKVRSCKRLLSTLKREKERDFACVVDQLALLEGRLRREQRDIQEQLSHRDNLVQAQRLEIERLSRDNERLFRDNRRLAHKVKKYAIAVGDDNGEKRERRVKFSRLDSIEDEDEDECNSCNNIGDHPLPNTHLETGASGHFENVLDTGVIPTSISGSNSQYQAESTNSYVTYSHYQSLETINRDSQAIVESYQDTYHELPGYISIPNRVLHKPPIAEKPKGLGRNLYKKSQSNVFMNIERPSVLSSRHIHTVEEESQDEESEETYTAGSSASEHSSPEATLKSATPKVNHLEMNLEDRLDPTYSFSSSNLLLHSPPSDSSLELHTSEVSNVKSYIMDEHEVTSGYNSDAVSDHDYENIRFGSLAGINNDGNHPQTKESNNNNVLSEKEEEYNSSEIFNSIEREQSLVDLNEDQSYYSRNSGFGATLQTDELKVMPEDRQIEEEAHNQTGDESQVTSILRDQSDVSCSPTASDEEVSKIMDSNISARSQQSITHSLDDNHMSANFEEFNLDSLELEKEEHSKICDESFMAEYNRENQSVEKENNKQEKEKENLPVFENERVAVAYQNIVRPPMSPVGGGGGQYEKFLEATGLSQKSILTPTRSLINHRSVVKPRDVKARNKLLRNSLTNFNALQEAP
ncbi:unnamed protein product [Meganyctiphanes norvegica]|uniref:Lebercilin n=1 Tax=Meganyctiphanes norvegica TaxID=48144 RepID=A0AAV2QLW4_MEGNR